MKKLVFFFLLVYLILNTIASFAQDPAIKHFEAVIHSERNAIEFKFETHGLFDPAVFAVARSLPNGGWELITPKWTFNELSNIFTIEDDLLKDGNTVFYEILRKTPSGNRVIKNVTLYDDKVTVLVYTTKEINNIIVKTSAEISGVFRLSDTAGNFVIDEHLTVNTGKLVISEVAPGPYILGIESNIVEQIFPIDVQ